MWAQGSKTSTGCRNALEPRKRSTHSSHKTMKEERTQKEKELVQKKIEDFINPIIGGHVPPGECIVGKLQTTLEELFQSTPDEKPVVSELESALREFIDSGGDQKCWPRILQNKFQRQHLPESTNGKALKEAKGYIAKSEFKVAWAALTLEHIEASKQHSSYYKKINKKKGTFFCFGALCEQYGILTNRDKAIADGTKHAQRATAMGGNWTTWDSMSDQVFYLYLRQEFIEEMGECWTMFETEKGDKIKPVEDGGGDGPTKAVTTTEDESQVDAGGGSQVGASAGASGAAEPVNRELKT